MKKRQVILFIIIILVVIVAIFNSNFVLRYLFENKVWAHKVNSIEKLNKARNKYTGVELDIVFYTAKEGLFFDVNHPPDSSINLSLTEYFQSNLEMPTCKYWLDFKNLNHENKEISSEKLDSVITALNINKSKIIVESASLECLNVFKEKGFYTSYYLPSKLHKLDSVILTTTLEKISKNISLYNHYYISADYSDYPILKEHFSGRKKIIWFTVYGSMNNIKARFLLYKILMDKNVDVLLIPLND